MTNKRQVFALKKMLKAINGVTTSWEHTISSDLDKKIKKERDNGEGKINIKIIEGNPCTIKCYFVYFDKREKILLFNTDEVN